MQLRVTASSGREEVQPATPEAVEEALQHLGSSVQFLILEDGDRFMQDDGRTLEMGDNTGPLKLLRAKAGDVRQHGSLPAFASFLAGDGAWKTQYVWTDVTDDVPTVWQQRLQIAWWIVLLVAVVAFVGWRIVYPIVKHWL